MRIIFVRHGEPDYKHDCLTELGHLQAEDAAKRLREEGIEEILTSEIPEVKEVKFTKFYRKDISDLSYLFCGCSFLDKLNISSEIYSFIYFSLYNL